MIGYVQSAPEDMRAARVQDDIEIIDEGESGGDAFAAYFADGAKDADRTAVYDPSLGLAVEALPEGLTVDKLWRVV